jgi:glutaminyl-tRNA synthetase
MPQIFPVTQGNASLGLGTHAIDAEVRLYDRLFNVEDPGGENWKESINKNSLEILKRCKIEPGLSNVKPQDRFQFERLGYFALTMIR